MFRFYGNAISRASRNTAAVIFIGGLMLIGFGFLIWVLKELFAILFALLFCVVGVGCITAAVKIFWTISMLERKRSRGEEYRENVRIHIENEEDVF